MSIRAWYDVWCDASDCNQWVAGASSKTEAARRARRLGWVATEANVWFCPACVAKCVADKTPLRRLLDPA